MRFLQSLPDEPPSRRRARRFVSGAGATGVVAVALVLAAGGTAWAGEGHGHTGAGGSAPPGNNGTIKIDQTVLSPTGRPDHANHPHVSCQFALSFFGYDTGTQTADVSFSAQPPSGRFTPVTATTGPSQLQFTVARRAGGGQLDVSVPYQLDVSGLSAAQQGYHVRVTVDVTGAKGADGKSKVFWYQPCGGSTGSGMGAGSSGRPGPATGTSTGTSTSSSGGATLASSPTTSSAGTPSASISRVTSSAGRTGAAGALRSAPVTGVASGLLPTGAAADLGPFAPPGSGGSPFPWWELLAGLLLVAGPSGAAIYGRARRARA